MNEQPGSASVVQSVASSLNGIGYSGIGYYLWRKGGRDCARRKLPAGGSEFGKRASGEYPLSRYLYIYVNKKPNTALPPLEREFLKLVLSQQGQEIVVKDGYIPVSARIASRELKKIE